MNPQHPRPGFTPNSTPASISRPFTRISNHHTILIDVEPGNYSSDDDDDAVSPPAPECGYSRPLLFLDMLWNFTFVVVSIFVLLLTLKERPSTPLRLWVCGYALQCFLHVGFVWDEYQRRRIHDDDAGGAGDFYFRRVFSFSALCQHGIIKKLESINTIVSSVWWVFGFYWIVMGGQTLLQNSPRLYWLSVVFLAFDVFFMIFCIAIACIIFLLLFCFFPILASVAYAMTIGEGASENDIRLLPKYLYRQQSSIETFENEKKRQVNLTSNNISMTELVLQPEDSECCICLYKYRDGAELCTLPCNHHFHHKCITKWLRINATCPLCKFNILKADTLV